MTSSDDSFRSSPTIDLVLPTEQRLFLYSTLDFLAIEHYTTLTHIMSDHECKRFKSCSLTEESAEEAEALLSTTKAQTILFSESEALSTGHVASHEKASVLQQQESMPVNPMSFWNLLETTLDTCASTQRLGLLRRLLARCSETEKRQLLVSATAPFDLLTALPVELSWRILSYLDWPCLVACERVSHRWQELASDSRLWQRQCEQHIGRLCSQCQWQLPVMTRNRRFPKPRFNEQWKQVFTERFQVEKQWRHSDAWQQPPLALLGHTDGILCVQHDTDKIISGSYDATLRVWSTQTGACLHTLHGHQSAVRALQFDERKLVSGGMDKCLKVWCLTSMKCVRTLPVGDGYVCSIRFDAERLVCGTSDGVLRVWLVSDGTCFTMRCHGFAINAIELLPKTGHCLTASDDSTVKWWDLSARQCLRTLGGHCCEVTACVLLQPDLVEEGHVSDTLVTAACDNTLKRWSLSTGRCDTTFSGHEEGVWCVAMRHSQWMVSGAHDGVLCIWQSGQLVRRLDCTTSNEKKSPTLSMEPHLRAMNCVSVNDFSLVAGGDDGVLRLWRICERPLTGLVGKSPQRSSMKHGRNENGESEIGKSERRDGKSEMVIA